MIHMRIVQDNQLIADLPEWPHPIPRVGDYIYHPPMGNQDVIPNVSAGISGSVKVVAWRLYDRSTDPNVTSFVMTENPYVEVTI